MTNKKERPAWRVRYEEENPTVSFRVSREEKELLDKVRDEQGATFADLVLEGAKMRESDRNRALRAIRIGSCNRCKGAITWDLTNVNNRRELNRVVTEAKLIHNQCRYLRCSKK